MKVKERISALREAMNNRSIDAYIIPSSDPHQSEYVAEHWKCREWISGFTGSAGTVVVTADKAGLWTDSRYFLQGEEELAGTGIDLYKMGMPGVPGIVDWLSAELKKGDTLGIDGANFSIAGVRHYENKFVDQGIDVNYAHDLFEKVWQNRPELPNGKAFLHPTEFAGKSRGEKIKDVRSGMGDADGHVLTTLDDIAWVFNLRGHDVECNPVAIAYAVIEKNDVYLYIDKSKMDTSTIAALQADGVRLREYKGIFNFLRILPKGYKILLERERVNIKIFDAIPEHCDVVYGRTVSTDLKAKKTAEEVAHIREAMLKDAVALTRLFMWLDKELETRKVTEIEVAEHLIECRRAQGDYYGESFNAIVGYKGNGAIVHYRPLPGKCAALEKDGMLLLDSGGQYFNGTTDITRTIALSTPTAAQKRHNTLVLKGHIALARQHFLKGTIGIQLDMLARHHIWNADLNYGHGTGHGVGYFLNVHEGPSGIGPNQQGRYMGEIKEGMFLSNEPGFYLTDEYGIRIENLVLAVPSGNNGFGDFLKFETLTLFPIDLSLVNKAMMTDEEVKWLNDYHQEVWDKVSPRLNDEEKAWMKKMCRQI